MLIIIYIYIYLFFVYLRDKLFNVSAIFKHYTPVNSYSVHEERKRDTSSITVDVNVSADVSSNLLYT